MRLEHFIQMQYKCQAYKFRNFKINHLQAIMKQNGSLKVILYGEI